jgi:hypothetical protein
MSMNKTKSLNIKIKSDELRQSIRVAARAEGWTTSSGLRAWAKDTYNARLYIGEWGMTSITFKTEQDCLMFSLKHGVC